MSGEGVRAWDGTVIGPGSVVILPVAFGGSASGSDLITGSARGELFSLPAARLPHFLRAHRGTSVISVGTAPLAAALASHTDATSDDVEDVWRCTAEGRWIDLQLLDLLVRVADGDFRFRDLPENELAGVGGRTPAPTVENQSQNRPNLYQNRPEWDRIARLVAANDRLGAAVSRLSAETQRPQSAEYRLRPLNPQQADELLARVHTVIRELETKPAKIPTGEFEDVHRVTTGAAAPTNALAPAEPPPPTANSNPDPSVTLPGKDAAGLGTMVRGALALAARPALVNASRLVTAELGGLRDAAEDRYRRSARELSRCPEVREVFDWDGEYILRKAGGHFRESKALRGWLRHAAHGLVDRWHLPVAVPEGNDGEYVKNPEHWGCWAACDRALWGWRELHRTAEVIRFAEAAPPSSPRYELIPRLRSYKPNLEVYRRLGVPVFRPEPGRVFLSVRIRQLRLRCFAAVGLHRGYFTPRTSRLAGYFLGKKDPLGAVAKELYVADALATAGSKHAVGQTASDGPAADLRKTPRDHSPRWAAEERFANLRSDRPDEAELWVRRARGLLDAAILGLPNEALGVFLECEYQDPALGAAGAARALNLLASNVVYELAPFLENRLTDVVWARLGRSTQDELIRRHASSHPETFPQRVRNTLMGEGVEGLDLRADTHPPFAPPDGPVVEDGPGLFMVRGRSLGGRFTTRCSQPVVRQQEILMSADEVMLEVAHALVAGGHNLLAVAGEEILVEVPGRDASAAIKRVRETTTAAAARHLGSLADAVSVKSCDSW